MSTIWLVVVLGVFVLSLIGYTRNRRIGWDTRDILAIYFDRKHAYKNPIVFLSYLWNFSHRREQIVRVFAPLIFLVVAGLALGNIWHSPITNAMIDWFFTAWFILAVLNCLLDLGPTWTKISFERAVARYREG